MNSLGGRSSAIAWWCMAGLCAAFVAARLAPSGELFGVSQVVFLIPVYGAAVLTLVANRLGPPGDETRAWGYLSLAAWFLAGAESYYSYYQVTHNSPGPPSPSLFDWLTLAAALSFLLVLHTFSGLARRSLQARLRFAMDAMIVTSLILLVLYRFWSTTSSANSSPLMGLRWALDSFFGVAIIASILWLGYGTHQVVGIRRQRNLAVVGSVLVFAVGLLVSPLLPVSAGEPSNPSVPGALFSTFFMVGYSLMAIAGATRLLRLHGSWRSVMIRPAREESDRATSVISALMLVSICLSGYWVLGSATTQDAAVFLVFGLVATCAMVGRTALISHQSDLIRESVGQDPVTGVGSEGALPEQLESAIRQTNRSRTPFVLVVLNLDDFTRINDLVGRPGGDEVLARVGRALQTALPRKSVVLRLAGDSFAVIAPGYGSRDRMHVGEELLGAITHIDSRQGVAVSASIGVVSCDDPSCTKEGLLGRARAAQDWAKYHGKGRVIVYEDKIVRALGPEERFRLNNAHVGYEIARALMASADVRNPRGIYHSRNVAALAVLLAETTRMDVSQLATVEIAALLHDVGQIALSDDLIDEPLSPSRRLAAREHATLGAQLAEPVGIDGISAAIRGHHEHWDGTGYPDGLSGVDIPMEARIIALADAYDGMTSGRRTGVSMSPAAALQEIDHALGTRFDPLLAERFIRLIGTSASLGLSEKWVLER